jgi:hypothetical protein
MSCWYCIQYERFMWNTVKGYFSKIFAPSKLYCFPTIRLVLTCLRDPTTLWEWFGVEMFYMIFFSFFFLFFLAIFTLPLKKNRNATHHPLTLPKLMWLLKSPLDQNSIVIYQKFNDDFKSHINFGRTKGWFVALLKKNTTYFSPYYLKKEKEKLWNSF